MQALICVMLIVVGIIHLLPLSGVLGGRQLEKLYGLRMEDANLLVLMRHRAVLFGVLGAFFVVAGFVPGWQPLAVGAGYVSVVSFLWLSRGASAVNAQIARVVKADYVALGCLAVASGAWVVGWLVG